MISSVNGTSPILSDAWVLVKHVSQIPLWESRKLPEFVRVAKQHRNKRRLREIARLSSNLKKALEQRLGI